MLVYHSSSITRIFAHNLSISAATLTSRQSRQIWVGNDALPLLAAVNLTLTVKQRLSATTFRIDKNPRRPSENPL
jgi:hypothetical protein